MKELYKIIRTILFIGRTTKKVSKALSKNNNKKKVDNNYLVKSYC